jgi:hypothetical protein
MGKGILIKKEVMGINNQKDRVAKDETKSALGG